jgi:AraC family transcriptional regulator of adaptative response/methylated-DNA-[protein]-cysteine methyltransferase
MKESNEIDFHRIAEAIGYIQANFKSQPALDEVAEKVHLSPYHFQRMFTDWAGVSPKKFLQYVTVQHAKKILREHSNSLFDTAIETGLSGTGRLHDLFINIEGMTPGEYKNGGENLFINYSFAGSPFGRLLIASTAKGICYMAFTAHEQEALTALKQKFPKATCTQGLDRVQRDVLQVFDHDSTTLSNIKLHLKGTPFQLKVWETLLRIPTGGLCTYGDVAKEIQSPKASRAVGSAIGDNPVAFLIPCHRVIQSTGLFGQYMWGADRKAAIIGWEAVKLEETKSALRNVIA